MRRRYGRRGLTAVELMVALVIIAALAAAVLTPVFLNKRDDANDRAAQVTLRNAYEVAKADYVIEDTWDDQEAMAEWFEGAEPTYDYQTATLTSSNPRTVMVRVDDNGKTLTLCTRSHSQRVFCLRANEEGDLMS